MEYLAIATVLNLDLAIRLNAIVGPRGPEEMLFISLPSRFIESKPWHGLFNIIFGLNLLVLLWISFVHLGFIWMMGFWILCGISVSIVRAIFGQVLWTGVYLFPVPIVVLESVVLFKMK